MQHLCVLTYRFSSETGQTRRLFCWACQCPEPPRFSAEGLDGHTLCGPKSSSSPRVYLWNIALAQHLKDIYVYNKAMMFISEAFVDIWSGWSQLLHELYLIEPCRSWWEGQFGNPPCRHTCSCLLCWCRSDCMCLAHHIHQCLQIEGQKHWGTSCVQMSLFFLQTNRIQSYPL